MNDNDANERNGTAPIAALATLGPTIETVQWFPEYREVVDCNQIALEQAVADEVSA